MRKWSPQEVVLFLTLEVVLFLALERLKRGTKTNSPAYIYIFWKSLREVESLWEEGSGRGHDLCDQVCMLWQEIVKCLQWKAELKRSSSSATMLFIQRMALRTSEFLAGSGYLQRLLWLWFETAQTFLRAATVPGGNLLVPTLCRAEFGVNFLFWSGEFEENCRRILMANFDSEFFSLAFPGFQATQKIHARNSRPELWAFLSNFTFLNPKFIHGDFLLTGETKIYEKPGFPNPGLRNVWLMTHGFQNACAFPQMFQHFLNVVKHWSR